MYIMYIRTCKLLRIYSMYYIHTFVYNMITVPDGIGMVNLTCGAVDLINQCTVTWNVSVNYICMYVVSYNTIICFDKNQISNRKYVHIYNFVADIHVTTLS